MVTCLKFRGDLERSEESVGNRDACKIPWENGKTSSHQPGGWLEWKRYPTCFKKVSLGLDLRIMLARWDAPLSWERIGMDWLSGKKTTRLLVILTKRGRAGETEQLVVNQLEHHWEAWHHRKPEQWEAGRHHGGLYASKMPPPTPYTHSAGAVASGMRIEKGKIKESCYDGIEGEEKIMNCKGRIAMLF